jgi:hypothetical protein
MQEEVLENWFTYHAPNKNDLNSYQRIRGAAKHFAETVNELCPESADKTSAMRKIREAMMTANASIACGGK